MHEELVRKQADCFILHSSLVVTALVIEQRATLCYVAIIIQLNNSRVGNVIRKRVTDLASREYPNKRNKRRGARNNRAMLNERGGSWEELKKYRERNFSLEDHR